MYAGGNLTWVPASKLTCCPAANGQQSHFFPPLGEQALFAQIFQLPDFQAQAKHYVFGMNNKTS
jgi:hypothetical protein